MKHLLYKVFMNLRENGLGMTALKTKNYLLSFLASSQRVPDSEFQDTSLPKTYPSDADKTVDTWNNSESVYSIAGFKLYWELLDEVRSYQDSRMTDGRDMLEYLWSFFPKEKSPSNLTGLVIGCNYGEGSPPIAMARTCAFKKLIIVDIAKGLLEQQAEITQRMGLNHILEYRFMDLNTDSLAEEGICDLVFSLGTIHHIKRLEGLFAEINKSLRPDGIFCMREYVGPSCLQYTDKQIEIVDRILNDLPDHLKMQRDGTIKKTAWRPSVEELMAGDPSEAVRSREIIDIARKNIDVLVCKMTGGTILDPLLHGIAGNFERGYAERTILKTIIAMEKTLIDEGVISSDFVFLIAKKRNGI